MICPHCQRSIADHETPVMAIRTPPGQPLPAGMRALGKVGLTLIAALILAGLLIIARHHGLPVP